MMQLLALKCPTCGQKLKPENMNVMVMGCPNCLTAVSLQQSGIKAINVQYAATTSDKVETWLPMWVYNGRVSILHRVD